MNCHFDHFHVFSQLREPELCFSQQDLESLWKVLEAAVQVSVESSCCQEWESSFSWGFNVVPSIVVKIKSFENCISRHYKTFLVQLSIKSSSLCIWWVTCVLQWRKLYFSSLRGYNLRPSDGGSSAELGWLLYLQHRESVPVYWSWWICP